jgi:hypothetical protein
VEASWLSWNAWAMALAAIDMQKKSDDLSVAFLGMGGGLVLLGWLIAMHPFQPLNGSKSVVTWCVSLPTPERIEVCCHLRRRPRFGSIRGRAGLPTPERIEVCCHLSQRPSANDNDYFQPLNGSKSVVTVGISNARSSSVSSNP